MKERIREILLLKLGPICVFCLHIMYYSNLKNNFFPFESYFDPYITGTEHLIEITVAVNNPNKFENQKMLRDLFRSY